MKRILVVDDEPNVRLNYRITLDVEGYEVKEASDAKEAIQLLHDQLFDLAILDLRMPGTDGLELLRLIREEGVPTPAVIITAYSDVPNAVRAMKLGAIDFLRIKEMSIISQKKNVLRMTVQSWLSSPLLNSVDAFVFSL